MHTFWIVLITLGFVTAGLNWLTPVVIKYRLKGHGVDRPLSTYRKRVKEQKERYSRLVKHIDDESGDIISAMIVIPVFVLGCISLFGWMWKPLLLLIFFYLLYQLPFLLKNLFSKHIKTYMLIDEKALVVVSEYPSLSVINWKITQEDFDKYMKLPLTRSDYLKELDAFSDLAVQLVKLRETLEATRYQNILTLSNEKKEEHRAMVKKHEERYEELKNELFDVDKVWKYSIGVLEQPGVAFLNKEFEKKEVQPVPASNEQVSPAIEALLRLANDPETEESLRKYAMDTVKEIIVKTEAEKAQYQSEYKKDDAVSTIVAARKMHHLPLEK